ncbi:jerky protein homolog-like [Leptidea sinapis]|uniref:jerky protein homolog-like n=1 Tax=Leptidea sinapis TaxID=189913 RepID=UPI0021C3BDFB|nr:jerky protein homolog-like [Leptidea sinapis]
MKSGLTPVVGYKPRLVFNEEQETLLSKYILRSASIYFGLLPEEVRQLAYQCAMKFNVHNIPPSWHTNGEAGKDWLTNFLKRNSTLSIRIPEATSAGRASSFNRHNVNQFFEKLGDLITKHNLTPSRIWNLDETGVQTVLNPKKILAEKGTKQVGAIVSTERGTLVTVELAVSALGNSIPPMFVFPRLKYKDLFIRDGPPECIGAGNKSGWMTSTEFLVFMDHFIKHTKPRPEVPVLLLLDNHSSHIDIDVIEKAKKNSVILLSFPPHCTHRLQPLDVGVNGPFKTYCSKAQNNWLRTNPGKIMSIYEIPGIVKYAFPLAVTPINICNAFKKAGIWPYNSNVFTDEDYAPSFVTDRPMPENRLSQGTDNLPVPPNNRERTPQYLDESNYVGSNVEIETSPSILQHVPVQSDCRVDCTSEPSANQEPTPCCSFQLPQSADNNTGDKNTTIFSPELIRPLPKAPPRLNGYNKRLKRMTAVLTDTPEKNALK